MSFWKRLFGARRQTRRILEPGSDPTANPSDWESSGEPEAWVRAHLKGWDHQDWLDLLSSLRKSPYWPMDEAAVGEHLEMLRARLMATEAEESPTTNLDRWKSSGEAEAWVLAHLKGWNHQDWLELLASLRKSPYWPMDEAAVGEHLEVLRARLTTEIKESSTTNLDRWNSSGEPEAWVLAHLQGWNHQDWLELLASLRTSSYWPMSEPALGQHLEQLRDSLREGDASSCRLTSPAPPPADANGTDSQGQTALIRASNAGDRDAVKLLIAAGAQVNVKDYEGQTPLHFAADEYTAALLLANQADVDARADAGATPLHRAAQSGRTKVAIILIAYGAQVNARSKDGRAPLHMAADEGHKDVAELLLANGAEVDAKAIDGRTPLYLAVRKRHKDVSELLLARGADVNLKNGLAETPLHFVADDPMANLLRQYGGHW